MLLSRHGTGATATWNSSKSAFSLASVTELIRWQTSGGGNAVLHVLKNAPSSPVGQRCLSSTLADSTIGCGPVSVTDFSKSIITRRIFPSSPFDAKQFPEFRSTFTNHASTTMALNSSLKLLTSSRRRSAGMTYRITSRTSLLPASSSPARRAAATGGTRSPTSCARRQPSNSATTTPVVGPLT